MIQCGFLNLKFLRDSRRNDRNFKFTALGAACKQPRRTRYHEYRISHDRNDADRASRLSTTRSLAMASGRADGYY